MAGTLGSTEFESVNRIYNIDIMIWPIDIGFFSYRFQFKRDVLI